MKCLAENLLFPVLRQASLIFGLETLMHADYPLKERRGSLTAKDGVGFATFFRPKSPETIRRSSPCP